MRQTRSILRTALALLALAGTGAATAQGIGQTGLLNQGEQLNVPQARTQSGNIVGGGPVTVLYSGSEEIVLRHTNPDFAFTSAGIPVDTGGSNGDVLYLTPNSGPATMTAEITPAR